MTSYSKFGSMIRVADDAAVEVYKKLPVGVYSVAQDPFGNFYLECQSTFELPKKFYGDLLTKVDRIISTFTDRPMSTGILLSGQKGSGKTLLAKKLSIELGKQGIPTILVNKNYHGEVFNTFLAAIDEPVMILFDEYEKLYSFAEQEKMLTLFDGTITGKKLYCLTFNKHTSISEFMINRPGRFYYSFDYKGLDKDFVLEYVTENLIDKSKIYQFERVPEIISPLSFDILQAIVEEINRYGENVVDVIKFLNISLERASDKYFEIKKILFKNPEYKKQESKLVNTSRWISNVMADSIEFNFTSDSVVDPEEDEDVAVHVRFSPIDIVSIQNGVIQYENQYGILELQEKNKKISLFDIF